MGLSKWDGVKQRLLIIQRLLISNQYCFGCRGTGVNPIRRVPTRLERLSKRRGTIPPAGHALH